MAETYRRLPGRSFGLFGSYSLWAGTDHLLAVESRRFIENYRRFYYADIFAIQISERRGIGLPLEVLLGLAMLLLIVETYRHYWLAIFSVPAIFIYVWDKLRGQRCYCAVRTATGTWRLPAQSRTKAARACLEEIRPLVAGSQNEVEVHAALEAGALPHFAATAPAPVESGLVYMWPLFITTLLSSGIAWYNATRPASSMFATAEWVVGFGVVVLAVLALSLHRNPSSGGPRLAALSIVGMQCLRLLLAFMTLVFVESLAVAGRTPDRGASAFFEQLVRELASAENGIRVVTALAAVAGILTLILHRKKTA